MKRKSMVVLMSVVLTFSLLLAACSGVIIMAAAKCFAGSNQ